MNTRKIIFVQAILIPVAILFAQGLQYVILHFAYGVDTISWPWYVPISYIITGFASLPTLLLLNLENLGGKQCLARIGLHFVITGALVSLCGFLFHWYRTPGQYIAILILYVIIYLCVWGVTMWMLKSEDKKINDAIDQIRDDE